MKMSWNANYEINKILTSRNIPDFVDTFIKTPK